MADHLRIFARALLSAAAIIVPAASAFFVHEGDARAQAPAKHKAVLYTEGGRSAEVTQLVKEALGDNVEYVASDMYRNALAKRGQKVPLGITVTLDGKRQNMLGRMGKAAA